MAIPDGAYIICSDSCASCLCKWSLNVMSGTSMMPMTYHFSINLSTIRFKLLNMSGGSGRSQWEDITGSAPVNLVKDSVSFSTTVSARFVVLNCTHCRIKFGEIFNFQILIFRYFCKLLSLR